MALLWHRRGGSWAQGAFRHDTTQSLHESTHCDAGAKPRARLRASSTDVVAHSRVLAARSVQVGHRPWTVSAGETSGPRWVGACIQTQRGSRAAQKHPTTVAATLTCYKTFKSKEHITGFIRLSPRTCLDTYCLEKFIWQNGAGFLGLKGPNFRLNPVWYSKFYLHALCIMHRSNIHFV